MVHVWLMEDGFRAVMRIAGGRCFTHGWWELAYARLVEDCFQTVVRGWWEIVFAQLVGDCFCAAGGRWFMHGWWEMAYVRLVEDCFRTVVCGWWEMVFAPEKNPVNKRSTGP